MAKRQKCGHAYYNRVAMCSMCDYYCTKCGGYRKACGVREKEQQEAAQ